MSRSLVDCEAELSITLNTVMNAFESLNMSTSFEFFDKIILKFI